MGYPPHPEQRAASGSPAWPGSKLKKFSDRRGGRRGGGREEEERESRSRMEPVCFSPDVGCCRAKERERSLLLTSEVLGSSGEFYGDGRVRVKQALGCVCVCTWHAFI